MKQIYKSARLIQQKMHLLSLINFTWRSKIDDKRWSVNWPLSDLLIQTWTVFNFLWIYTLILSTLASNFFKLKWKQVQLLNQINQLITSNLIVHRIIHVYIQPFIVIIRVIISILFKNQSLFENFHAI